MKTRFQYSPVLGTAAALSALLTVPLAVEFATGVDTGVMTRAVAKDSGMSKAVSAVAESGGSSGHSSGESGGSGGHSGGSGGSKGGGQTSDSNKHGSSQNADHGSTPHSGGMAGGLKLRHGMGKNHVGHVPGQHDDATTEGEKGQKGQNGQSGKRRGGNGGHDVFAGGTGLGGTEHVPEGVATAVVVADAAPLQVAATEQVSNGFGPQHKFRFRYWGGRNIPGDDGGGDDGGEDGGGGGDGEVPSVVVAVAPPTAVVNTGGGGPTSSFTLAAAASCDDHVPGTLSGWDRYSRRNVERMDRVMRSLAPEVSGDAWMSKSYLVANIQDELEKPKPDTTLVGTYFGLVATNPVSPEIVKSACYALCVGVDGGQAHEIAKAAEVQRLVLK